MSVVLIINGKKTEVMPINFTDPVVIHTLSQEILKVIKDFKYLGSALIKISKLEKLLLGML